MPLVDKIAELSLKCELLVTGSSADLDTNLSWFAVSWYPILCDHTTSRALSGCFLTYHKFTTSQHCPLQTSTQARVSDWSPARGSLDVNSGRCRRCRGGSGMEISDVHLHLFGFISYRISDETWLLSSIQNEQSLQRNISQLRWAVVEWLRSQKIVHPDFEHMRSL